MTIDRLEWDDWNTDHLAKHGVTPQQAAEVIAGASIARETYKGRLQVIGPTQHGVMLSVVVGPVPDQPGSYYVFSARPASRKERAFYQHQQGASL